MNYWWVNHKQTHKAEIEGGYIWSPKKNKNGSTNQTYINLTKVRTNDLIFSYADTKIKAIGIVQQPCIEMETPEEFGKVGEQWDKQGWLVKVDWVLLDTPFKPKDNLDQIVPLLPERHSPIQANGNGNQSCYLAAIDASLGERLILISQAANLHVDDFVTSSSEDHLDEEEEDNITHLAIAETEKTQLVKSRRGQGLFRSRVERIEKGCRVTGVTDKRFLIASHIKPWRDSDNIEKLDGHNGFLLSPHVDKLFDKGWVTFDERGDMFIADTEIKTMMNIWGLETGKNIGTLSHKQKKYLEYHQGHVYKPNVSGNG